VFRALLPRPHVYTSRTGSHDWIITHPGEFAEAVGAFAEKA
jgi:hypothetical protein